MDPTTHDFEENGAQRNFLGGYGIRKPKKIVVNCAGANEGTTVYTEGQSYLSEQLRKALRPDVWAEMSKDPRSEMWRGAEWYIIERIQRNDMYEVVLASARIKTVKAANPDYYPGTRILDYETTVKNWIMDVHALDVAYFSKLLKHYPILIGYLNTEWYSVLLDLSKMARTAATGKYAIYRDNVYFMFYGTDTITIVAMMQIADVLTSGMDPNPKWWTGKAISCLVRDYTDRFGLNHTNNVDPMVAKLGDFVMSQIPREAMNRTLLFDEQETVKPEQDDDVVVNVGVPVYMDAVSPELMRKLDRYGGRFVRSMWKPAGKKSDQDAIQFKANPNRELNKRLDEEVRAEFAEQFATLKALIR